MDNNVTTAFCFPVCSVGSVQLPLTWLTAVQCWAVQAGQSLVTAGPGHIQDIHPWPETEAGQAGQDCHRPRLAWLSRVSLCQVWLWFCGFSFVMFTGYTIIRQLWSSLTTGYSWDSISPCWILSRDMSNSCTCHLSVSENSEQNYLWNYSKSKREAGVDSYMSFSDFFRNGRTLYLTMECQ